MVSVPPVPSVPSQLLPSSSNSKQPEPRDPTSGLFCSCIHFVFCGKRTAWPEPARSRGMVQLSPRLSHFLAPQCLMKQILLSPLSSAPAGNVSLRGSKSLFLLSHPNIPALTLLKLPAQELGLGQGNSIVLHSVLVQGIRTNNTQKLSIPCIAITNEHLFSKTLTNRKMTFLTRQLLPEFCHCLFLHSAPHLAIILPCFQPVCSR